MSELRERCKELGEYILDLGNRWGVGDKVMNAVVDDLEAFAKAERIKMLEEVRPMIDNLWVAAGSNIDRHEEYMAWIDAEIKKLKEVK